MPAQVVATRSLPHAHAWMPTSPCGPGCFEPGGPGVGPARAAVRLAAAAAVVLAAVLSAPALALLRGTGRTRLVRGIFTALLRGFGVRLVVHGEPLGGSRGRGALVVSNHISWLDIVVVNAILPMRALAKAEIARWPVLGTMVTSAGTIYVDRERLSALPETVAELAGALRGGSLVHVCAEGTTWCGRASGRFVPAPFQAAIDGGVPVRPLGLRYRVDGGRQTTRPAFLGTESLLASVLRVARLRGLVVEVFVCPEIAPGRADNRRELAELAEAAVHAELGVARVRTGSPKPVPDTTSAG